MGLRSWGGGIWVLGRGLDPQIGIYDELEKSVCLLDGLYVWRLYLGNHGTVVKYVKVM